MVQAGLLTPWLLPGIATQLLDFGVPQDQCWDHCFLFSIGWFSEAGLHEWMPFVTFRTRSCEKSQHHFRADFWVGVASRCELNLELWSSTNATTVAVAKITWERGWRVEKNVCVVFGWAEDRKFMRKMQFGASYSTSNKLLLVARHILTMGLQKCLKVGSVKFANSLSPPSIVKKVHTGSKSSQGT